MKNRAFLLGIVTMAMALLAGCGARTSANTDVGNTAGQFPATENSIAAEQETEGEAGTGTNAAEQENAELPHIYLRLGEAESRPSYEIVLEDNEVSERFVRILQEAERVIPLYVFDGSEHTDVLQFYDIPSSYDIPDGEPQTVTKEQAGEVYYSAGRIMIFYQNAEIEGNYVKIGETLTVEGLSDAVNSNPLDDWGNRRVTIGIIGEE